ncbi:MAG: ribonuclease P protein component [Proteobacteria bacterium]|nr:ribonuclease P protein component [Pseudomonadota bacterium]
MPSSTRGKFSFSRKHRLSSKRRIDELFQKGEFRTRGYLKFRFLPNDEGCMRIVLTVSKRVGNSPQRNRLKRLVREALRLSGELQKRSLDCGIFITKTPGKPPVLEEIKEYLGWFLSHLPDENPKNT